MAIELFATQATVAVACLLAQTWAAIAVATLAAIPVARLAATLGWFMTMLQQAWERLLLHSQWLSQWFLLLLPLLLQQPKERLFLAVAAPLGQLNQWLIQLRLSFAPKGSEGVLGGGLSQMEIDQTYQEHKKLTL